MKTIKNNPVIKRQSALSITPPLTNICPSCSAFNARFNAVKKRAPKGATSAMKQVIVKRLTYAGVA